MRQLGFLKRMCQRGLRCRLLCRQASFRTPRRRLAPRPRSGPSLRKTARPIPRHPGADPSEIRVLEFKGKFRRFGFCSISTTIGIDRQIFSLMAAGGSGPTTQKKTTTKMTDMNGELAAEIQEQLDDLWQTAGWVDVSLFFTAGALGRL